MNLQNLNYTINNLSPRQKIAILAGIVGASAVISTIALSQRQSSRTTVNQTPSTNITNPSSPFDATTVPNTTGDLDATLAPGVIDSSGTNPTSPNNNAAINSGSNLNSSRTTDVVPNNSLRGGGSAVSRNNLPLDNNGVTNSTLNPTIPNTITTSPNSNLTPTLPRGAVAPPITTSPNLTTTSPSRTFIPSASSPSGASTNPVIPRTTSPSQITVPSATTTPTNTLIPQDPNNIAPTDSAPPSSTENIPTFDSRTGTYTTTPRTPINSSPSSAVNNPYGSLNSPSSTFNNSRNNSSFNSNFNSNPNFSRPSGGSINTTSTNSPIYGNSNGTSSSNPIYSNPNGNINSNSIYGTPNGGSTSNTSPNGTNTSGN